MAAAEEPGASSFLEQRCCILLPVREEEEELWLTCSHAPLKDYICKASAFNSCADSPEPIAAQTAGDRGGFKDI